MAKRKTPNSTMASKAAVIIFTATILLAAATLYYSSQRSFGSGTETNTLTGVTCSSYSNSFTIIASTSGYNDSIGHGAPKVNWPVLCVHEGESVKIIIKNTDYAEPHGFSISHYAEAGVTILPGQSVTLTFFADARGDFRIYCNVICAIHPFMQSGLLVVTS
jgi:heme/copper-type cytochrome/quinol oxidase subunit 2